MAIGLVDIEALVAALPGVRQTQDADGRVIALPSTAEEVAATTRALNERGLGIEISGAGTKRDWANPTRADLVLNTTQLSGVREHRWQDLTATVGAGTTWAAMQRELSQHGQFVALDPLWPEKATVGGIVAANDSGALRLSYGSLRDLIIGMTIVLADGTIAKSGGKVVKNVAGYDLHKLMTGAFGTLGVIADVTFRLHPATLQTRVWSAASSDAEALRFLTIKMREARLSIRAMQMRASVQGYALDIELSAAPDAMAQQMDKLNAMARGCGGSLQVTHDPALRVFGMREALFAGAGVVVKVTMLPSEMAKLSREVVELGGEAVTQTVGILFARFSEKAAPDALAALRALVKAEESASLTVLRAPAIIPRAAMQVAPSVGEGATARTALMQEIKRQFDANGTLNPGRMAGI